jgi:choline-sulfatase
MNTNKKPNVLFLMSDEHRADVTGYEGNEIIRTPFLDTLANTGVVFRNAYTPSPICVPMRQCMMAGQFPKTCGCERYGEDLQPFHMTFSRLLAQYGYHTVVCGKLHHMGIDQMQGWTERIGWNCKVDQRYIKTKASEYRHHRSSDGKWSDAKEIRRAGVGTNEKDAYALDGALRFVKQYFSDPMYDKATPDRPLLLKVSFNRPHYPYFTDEQKFTYYLNRVQPYIVGDTFDHPFLKERQVQPGIDVSERELYRATAAYYGMIEEIDEDFKKVADALEMVGQNLDDWVVIYTSDHGEMLGEHGIWEKQKFFEASVRVPLIIRYPKRFEHRIVTENVNLCDLFATLCDLTSISPPANLDSRNLVPIMEGDVDLWDNETISHFGMDCPSKRKLFGRENGANLMIKRHELKYQYYGENMSEVLFDLHVDPRETINFIDYPEYASRVEAFRKRRDELGYGPVMSKEYLNV